MALRNEYLSASGRQPCLPQAGLKFCQPKVGQPLADFFCFKTKERLKQKTVEIISAPH